MGPVSAARVAVATERHDPKLWLIVTIARITRGASITAASSRVALKCATLNDPVAKLIAIILADPVCPKARRII